jgi:serine/threonine-protein kinase
VERAAGREALAARGAQPVPAQTAAVPAAGTLQLAILPWGEVFVNGKSRGVSPPLRSVELPPGTHTVEVRNTSVPIHTRRVEVRAGEPVRIRHRFR